MDIGHSIIHISPIHFREPVVNAAEHAEKGRNTHHDMEVGNNKICIMQMYIQCRVAEEDARKSAGKKQAHEANGKKHPRCKPDIPAP